jgi:hypothetical protein
MSIITALNDSAVIDASCLITLIKAKMDFILPQLYKR